jgi:glycosyltransferase involved in cell wall biosynthesis
MSSPRILFLPRYSENGASSRCRTFQLLPLLRHQGFECDVFPLFSREYLITKYEGLGPFGMLRHGLAAAIRRVRACARFADYDLVVLEKELIPNAYAWVELALLASARRLVLDYDDAIWVTYRDSCSLRNKIASLMGAADAVIGGSDVIVAEARRHARRVVKIPTAVDLELYQAREVRDGGVPVIGWIGTPITAVFLSPLAHVFSKLACEFRFKVLLVGARPDFQVPGVEIEHRAWSLETEVDAIRAMDVGVMPLPDSDFARGKCGYKLIQYMACGLPTVASAVGENNAIVDPGITGFLARDEGGWIVALRRLLASSQLRNTLGAAGREKAVKSYGLAGAAEDFGSVLREVLRGLPEGAPPCAK